MLLAAAGGVEHEHLVHLTEKYFGKIEHGSKDVLDYEPGVFKMSTVSFIYVTPARHKILMRLHKKNNEKSSRGMCMWGDNFKILNC